MVVEGEPRQIGLTGVGVQAGKIAVGPVGAPVFGGELGGALKTFGGLGVPAGFVERDPGPDLDREVRRRRLGAGDEGLDAPIGFRRPGMRRSLPSGTGFLQPARRFPEAGLQHRVDGFVQRLRADPQDLFDDPRGVQAPAVALQHLEDRAETVFPFQVFEDERGVEVGNSHLPRPGRPHEPVVQVRDVEQPSVPQRQVERKARPVAEAPALLEQAEAFREPARDAVVGKPHGRRMGKLVPEGGGPVVRPDLPRRRGFEGDHVPEADTVGADTGDAHRPNREVRGAVVDLDAERFRRFVPVALPEGVHRFP